MEKYSKETRILMHRLLKNVQLYFDKNLVLNSDGRKLLLQLLRYLLSEHHEYRDLVTEVRRNPTIENIVKLAKAILPPREIEEILNLQFKNPYSCTTDNLADRI